MRNKRAGVDEDFCYDVCRVFAFEFRIMGLEVTAEHTEKEKSGRLHELYPLNLLSFDNRFKQKLI